MEVNTPEDVTAEDIGEAADMREGLYGGEALTWHEVIYHLESAERDWGSSMESPAIKHLQREVRRVLRERKA